mgnify:CR=1 FL=1|tara:strand:- start:397 stop:918 length:522 start_codon:yes stop_codon:yes gene_type:complete
MAKTKVKKQPKFASSLSACLPNLPLSKACASFKESHFNRTSLAMMIKLSALAVLLVTGYFMATEGADIAYQDTELVKPSRAMVHVRAADSATAEIISKVPRNTPLELKSTTDTWFYVQGEDFKGWVSKSVASIDHSRVISINYRLNGFELGLLLTLALFLVGWSLQRSRRYQL